MYPKITLSLSSRFLPLSEVFLVLLVSLVWWPCFIVLTILNLSLRRIVQILYKTLHDPESYILAAGEDSVFGYKVKGNCNSLIAGYQVIKGKPDLALIQRKFQAVLSNKDYSRLKYSFTSKYGYFCWRLDQAFSLSNHIRPLEENLGRPLTESDLLSLVQSLVRQDMPDTRPQWEVLLVPNYIHENERDEQHYALIIRFNHAYSDAISYYLMLNEYVADTKASFPSGINPFSNPFPIPFWGKILIWTKAFFMGPYSFVKIMSLYILDFSVFTTKNYEDGKLCGRSSRVKMSLVKELKRRSGASVTSLLYTVVYSALEKSHKRDFPSRTLPKDLHLGSVMAMFPYWKDRKMGNQFTLWPYTAPLSIVPLNPQKSSVCHDNLYDRLQVSHRIVQEALSGSGPLFNFYLARALGSIPVPFHALLWQLSGSPVMLSNVPGVEERMQIFGGEMVDAAGFLPLMSTVGMGLSTMTYAGDLRFNCIVDPQVYRTQPQLQRFLDDIVEDLYKLAEMYGVKVETVVDRNNNEKNVQTPLERKTRPSIRSQIKDLKDLNGVEIEEENELKVVRRCIQSL